MAASPFLTEGLADDYFFFLAVLFLAGVFFFSVVALEVGFFFLVAMASSRYGQMIRNVTSPLGLGRTYFLKTIYFVLQLCITYNIQYVKQIIGGGFKLFYNPCEILYKRLRFGRMTPMMKNCSVEKNILSRLKIWVKFLLIAFVLGVSAAGCAGNDKIEDLEAEIVLPRHDMEIKEDETIYFEGAAGGGVPPYTYSWDFGVGIPPSNEYKPGLVGFKYEGAYKVLFYVKDAQGKTRSDFVRIIVKPNQDIGR